MPWCYVEALRFIAACFALGSVAGLAVTLAKGQRHGS